MKTRNQLQKRKRHVLGLINMRRLKSNPCIDCGKRLPWYVMEFDHIEEKTARVASVMASPNALKKELKKCELVCANCHKSRTHWRAVASGERTDSLESELHSIQEQLNSIPDGRRTVTL